MIALKNESIVEFLKNEKLEPLLEKESKQHYFNVKVNEKDIPIFFRSMEKSSVLQLIAYPPTQIKEETFGEIARFLHILNKELDIPGFGMDEKTKLIFYRVVLPSLNQEIDEKMLKAYINTIRNALAYFFAGVEAAAKQAGTKAETK